MPRTRPAFGALAIAAVSLVAACTPPGPGVGLGGTSGSYRFPVAGRSSYAPAGSHAGYPAADVFASCGTPVVAPTGGTVLEVRTTDLWDRRTDNPAHRGGRYVAIRGDDGVRYYLAHLATVDPTMVADARIAAGHAVGTLGRSGRAGACHLHLGISTPCAGKEWQVRRGVVWPQRHLDAWRRGIASTPADDVARWAAANPHGCRVAMSALHAAEA